MVRADGRDTSTVPSMRRHVLRALAVGALFIAVLTSALTSSALADEKSPKVTKDPSNVIVEAGHSATFEATASGPPTPTVQWQISTNEGVTWNRIEGATSDQFTIAETTTSESGDRFRAVFKNPKGQAVSEAATLTVRIPPSVTEEPVSTTVEEGQSASFEAAGSGFPTPSVQWELSTNEGGTWSKIAKANADKFTIASAKTSENGNEYRATFENTAGRAITAVATLSVRLAPKVTTQPANTTVEVGGNATFEAVAAGTPTPTVQWEFSTNGSSWTPVEGATSDKLTIADAQRSETGDEYRATFENVAGHTTSNAATLTVQDAPKVTEQPASTTVEVGQGATFEAAASGIPAPTVQWELSTSHGSSWSAVEGATSDQLTIASAASAESGDEYRAVFTSSAGTATSMPATLTVASHHYAVVDWGSNAFGQLGDASTNNTDVPVTPSGLKFVTAVAGSQHNSLALLTNGTVMAWGEDEYGQLGAGPGEETPLSEVPVPVEGLSNVVEIAAGNRFGLALLSNGTVEAWGGNESGQLGDGNLEESETPVPVKGLTGVTAIAAGGEHGLALLSNGTIKSWGANASGELGNGSFNNTDFPVSVIKVTGVTAIAADGENSLAVLQNGSLVAWGDDEYGQLGNPEVEEEGSGERESNVAVPVDGVSGATAVAAGQRFSMALLASGSVMAWGENRSSQLGDGTTTRSDEKPALVSDLSGVSRIAAGGAHAMALLSNGDAMTWGENRFGELGNGTVDASSALPVQVGGLGEQVGIAAGSLHDLAYGEPIPTVTGVSPNGAPLSGGTAINITGIDLSEASAVSFGGTAASSFTVNSSTSITAVAPAHSAGTVNVTVTTPAGTSPVTSADELSYQPPPIIKKLSPKSGAGSGGTVVAISGERFSGASAVTFGSTAAASFTVNSATSITAVTPAGSAGSVSVTVTTPFGTSAASEAKFKYKKK